MSEAWQPRFIVRQEDALLTGTRAIKVVTDQGPAYLKALGNPEGPHVLVCDLIGTRLARWFGLPTFEFNCIEVKPEYGLQFYDADKDGTPEPGPAFITKYDPGEPWAGSARQLSHLSNPEALTRLVLLDTWILNCDRHDAAGVRKNYDNVFLSEAAPPGQLLLRAMDHSHCLTCGRDLTPRLAHIDQVRHPGVFGLFPEFQPHLDREEAERAVSQWGNFDAQTAELMTEAIPAEWVVSSDLRRAINQFLVARAAFLAGSIMKKLWPAEDP